MQSTRRRSYRILSLALALSATLSLPGLSHAGLVINVVPAVPPGTAPVMTGGGNLPDIMNAAAGFWMAAFPEVNWTVNLQYHWGGLTEALNAQFVNPQYSDGHIVSGDILFNNTTVDWYADANPHNVAGPAYGPLETINELYNGNLLNIGRVWSAPVDSPAYGNLDLLMVAEHEIGHALGLYAPPVTTNEVIISAGLSPEFAGYPVFLEMLDHISNPLSAIMASGLFMPPGDRKGISAIDILTIAEINGWERPNLDPYQVPEPPSVVLMGMGIVFLGRCFVVVPRRARLSMAIDSKFESCH